uniref:Uncharacterized protein n=1 Tax=Tanacetum cinerariifolium TaxID=118510 RepID=A0A699H9Z4_TANCI|nr:hypothetical protein [Tanacetum cinerariifolium]
MIWRAIPVSSSLVRPSEKGWIRHIGIGEYGVLGCFPWKGRYVVLRIMNTRFLEQDELPSSVGLDFRAQWDDDRIYSRHLEAKRLHWPLTTSRLIDGSPCCGINMVIKDLDLEPKIDAMMRDFLDASRWKDLRKKTSTKILPSRDGSCRKMFKPIASLIANEKLK